MIVLTNKVPKTLLTSWRGACAGHGSPEESEMLDPRDSYVRTRSIFTILQASGHYFKGGNAHAKLKKYFVFLQCYLLAKEELPADLQVLVFSFSPAACRMPCWDPFFKIRPE